jgi:hypothetical protein
LSDAETTNEKETTMTTSEQDQEIEVMQKLAKILLVTILSLTGLFVVSGAILTMLMH